MRRIGLSLMVLVALGTAAADADDVPRRINSANGQSAVGLGSAGTVAVERASAGRKFAFVFFWKEQNPQTDRAFGVLQASLPKMSDWADLVSVQVTDPAEKALVDRFDASRAPMPLVLAVAPSGAVTKAFTGEFDETQLRTAFVSPCTQLSLKALQDRKLVLLCVFDQSGAGTPAWPPGVREFKADDRYGPAAEVVMLNARDAGEAAFLKDLQVNAGAPKPFTVLLAPPGSVIGQFDGRASKEQLLAKLAAAQSNPCAAGQCGPTGCGPRK